MIYEERKNYFCNQCRYNTGCAYTNRSIEYRCIPLNEIMGGWEYGYNDAVEAAIEFIYQRQSIDLEVRNIDVIISDFRKYMEKYMEEQQ